VNEQVLEADLTYVDGRLRPGIQVAVRAGMIEAVGPLGLRATRRLRDAALVPGCVSAHSHAFQRGLRGHAREIAGQAGNFWSWRDRMYALAEELDRDGVYTLSRLAFRELRAAGVTTVGEFHYLRHASSERDYGLDGAVLDAARDARIRIVLLPAYYRTGGIAQPLTGAQLRFATADPDEYWQSWERLAAGADGSLARLGAAVHSVRAASAEEVATMRSEAARRGLVCHMHVEEQPREVEDCRAAYGRTPMQLILENHYDGERFTAVHATQTPAAELTQLAASGGGVCVCPTTEAHLGDGIPDAAIAAPGDWLSLGTDANARISMLDEMRWLEYGQRLGQRSRDVFGGPERTWAERVLDIGTAGGAAALGLPAGRIRAGAYADLVALDLSHPTLSGAADPLGAWLTGGDERAILGTAVAGEWEGLPAD
jgi:formiminoglutamate deiminase